MYLMLTAEVQCLKQQGYKILGLGDMNGHIGNGPDGIEGNKQDVNKNGELLLGFAKGLDISIINTNQKITKGLFTRRMNGIETVVDYGLMSNEMEEMVK